ncbi:hypothetical protein ACF08B_38125 [Streptomyces sp. NPDC015139]|uniref:hypothetical protein n=1 Tax=Streptomyces sp. NPDC015139 TaxID=3364942 RepID=UPI0036FDDE2C
MRTTRMGSDAAASAASRPALPMGKARVTLLFTQLGTIAGSYLPADLPHHVQPAVPYVAASVAATVFWPQAAWATKVVGRWTKNVSLIPVDKVVSFFMSRGDTIRQRQAAAAQQTPGTDIPGEPAREDEAVQPLTDDAAPEGQQAVRLAAVPAQAPGTDSLIAAGAEETGEQET